MVFHLDFKITVEIVDWKDLCQFVGLGFCHRSSCHREWRCQGRLRVTWWDKRRYRDCREVQVEKQLWAVVTELAFVSSFDQKLDLMVITDIVVVTFVFGIFLLNLPRMDLELGPAVVVGLLGFIECQNCFHPK